MVSQTLTESQTNNGTQHAQVTAEEAHPLVQARLLAPDKDNIEISDTGSSEKVDAPPNMSTETKEKKKPGRKKKGEGQADGPPEKPRNPYSKPLKAQYIDSPHPLEFADGQSSLEYVLGWLYHHVIEPLGLENELELAESLIAQSFIRGMAQKQTSRIQRFKLLQQVRQFKRLGEEDPERAAVALAELGGRLKELGSAEPKE